MEICDACGAVRVCVIPGYQKSPAMLYGLRMKYCIGTVEEIVAESEALGGNKYGQGLLLDVSVL